MGFEFSLTRSGYRDLQQKRTFFYHVPEPGSDRAMCNVRTPYPLAKRHLPEYPKGKICERCETAAKNQGILPV